MPDLMRVSQLISETVEALAVEFPEAAERCRAVLATRRSAHDGDQPSAWQELSESELLELERSDWLTCGAAIRLSRESGEREGLEILDEICPQFGELASSRLFHPFPMFLYLGLECSDAYVSILSGGKSAEDIVMAWRDHVVWLYDTGNRRHGDPRRQAVVKAFSRLTESSLNRQPETFDALVGLIGDPDPRIRRFVATEYIEEAKERQMTVAAVLRLLERDEIDEDAIDRALQGILVLGYVIVSTPEGLLAIPLDPSRAAIGPHGSGG